MCHKKGRNDHFTLHCKDLWWWEKFGKASTWVPIRTLAQSNLHRPWYKCMWRVLVYLRLEEGLTTVLDLGLTLRPTKLSWASPALEKILWLIYQPSGCYSTEHCSTWMHKWEMEHFSSLIKEILPPWTKCPDKALLPLQICGAKYYSLPSPTFTCANSHVRSACPQKSKIVPEGGRGGGGGGRGRGRICWDKNCLSKPLVSQEVLYKIID